MPRKVASSESARGRPRVETGPGVGAGARPRARVRPRGRNRAGGYVGAGRLVGKGRLRGRVSSSALAVACLVVLPLLVYGVPAMVGHPVLPGDDLTQSLPLRVLVGRDLRSGQLPIFDPYIWSGAPLLAGWNAGAAYPLTWLFVVMPATAAWTVNVVAIALVAGVTMFAFLRACTLGVPASFLGALAFAFGGAMSAQIQHLGLVVGMSWVPLGLLASLRLTEPGRNGWRARLGWTAALAAAVALVILAGEPRAVANAGVILTVYALWRLARVARRAGLFHRLHRRTAETAATRAGAVSVDASAATAGWSVATVVVGMALGFGLGAVQLLPGLAAVATSQRAAVTRFVYSAGSFSPHWLLLFGVPDLLGGSGSYGEPHYFATYTLAEVTIYMGILPLVAAGALLARRRWRPLPEWVVWYAVGIVGLLLGFATHTPLWHVLIRVPLLGGQRLQSRSMMVTDLALAVLLAYWVDDWLRARDARAPRRLEFWSAAMPALGVAVVVVVALTWRVQLLEWMGVAASTARTKGAIGPWVLPFGVLALVAVVLLALGHRLSRRVRTIAVVAFVVVDLIVFSATTVVSLGSSVSNAAVSSATVGASTQAASSATAGASTRAASSATVGASTAVRPITALHLQGRFAIYDPTLRDGRELAELGASDANVVAGTYSVEGYGSIANGAYAAATGTHGLSGGGQDIFAPKAAADGVLDSLDTTDVFVPSPYLALPGGTTTPKAATGTGTRTTVAGGTTTWYLGTPVQVATATLQVRATVGAAPSSARTAPAVRIGLRRPTGGLVWSTSSAARAGSGQIWTARWAVPTSAVALVVETAAPSVLGAPRVTMAGGGRATLDGALQSAIETPHWVYAGSDGHFAIYRNTRATAPLTLHAVAGRTTAGATVHRRSGPALDPLAATVSSRHGVEVVRAVAAIPGWTAAWQPAGSTQTTTLPVRRSGVVQVVTVPAGTGVVTWRYVGPNVEAGEALSCAAAVLVVVLALGALWLALAERRRRRVRAVPPARPAHRASGP